MKRIFSFATALFLPAAGAQAQLPEFASAFSASIAAVQPLEKCENCAVRIPVLAGKVDPQLPPANCIAEAVPSTYYVDGRPVAGVLAIFTAVRTPLVEQVPVFLAVTKPKDVQVVQICWDGIPAIKLPDIPYQLELLTPSVKIWNKPRGILDFLFGSGLYNYQKVLVEQPTPSILLLGSATIKFPHAPVLVRYSDLQRSRVKRGSRVVDYTRCVRTKLKDLIKLNCN